MVDNLFAETKPKAPQGALGGGGVLHRGTRLTFLELRVVWTEELERLGDACHAGSRRPDLRGKVTQSVADCPHP